jgi:hypothetical protein
MQIYAVFGSDFDANAQHVDCYVKKAAIFNFSLARVRASWGSENKGRKLLSKYLNAVNKVIL